MNLNHHLLAFNSNTTMDAVDEMLTVAPLQKWKRDLKSDLIRTWDSVTTNVELRNVIDFKDCL